MGSALEEAGGWFVNPLINQADKLLQPLLDPGRGERERAQALDEQARQHWLSMLPKDANGQPIVTAYNDPQFSLDAPDFNTPGGLMSYGYTPGFVGSTAEWGDAGPSAFDSIGYDQKALSGMDSTQDYFSNLVESGGRDAQAEAEYARRVEQAEMQRRANADAAVRALETQGRGGSGATLLAGLTGAQGQASDQYQAGLDANAIAQARRDSAATSAGNMANLRGNYTAGVDQAKATGQDAWNSWTHEGAYSAADKNADRDQDARKASWDRINATNDANVALNNERAWWDSVGKNQAMWDRQQGVIAGATGQANNQAGGLRGDGTQEFNWGRAGMSILDNYTAGAASSGYSGGRGNG